MRLREQTGCRRLPGYADAHAVVRKVQATVNEPAEGESFPNRPPPVSPFPELVLELSAAIDKFMEERDAAGKQPYRLMPARWPSSMDRPNRRMWRPLAAAVVSVRDALLKEGLSPEEQAREREVRACIRLLRVCFCRTTRCWLSLEMKTIIITQPPLDVR